MRFDWPEQPLAGAIEKTGPHAFVFRDESHDPLFYHDCPEGTLNFARAHLTPQPLAPNDTALPGIPKVPRHAILCTEDRVIPPAYQAHMARDLPPGHVSELPTGHSPFFAAPKALAERLASIARAA